MSWVTADDRDSDPTREQIGHGQLILVVEDNSQTARLYAMHLHRAGFQVQVASSGEEAVFQANKNRPAAILLDLLLPAADGWDVLKQLKASSATRDIPVVIVSVMDSQAFGLQLGAAAYLVKPVDRYQLLSTLQRCLLQRKFAGRVPRIMVVHHDQAMLAKLGTLIAREGYSVVQALGGVEGLSLAESLPPQVIVLDAITGDMECAELVTALRGIPAIREVPVMVLGGENLAPAVRKRLDGFERLIFIEEDLGVLPAIRQLIGEYGDGK